MSILNIKNLTFSYKNKNSHNSIIENLSLELNKNELISIVGASGCGKSTLIKILAGIENEYSGEIFSSSKAYMPQKDILFPWRTILENILLPLEIKNSDLIQGKKLALNYLKQFQLDSYAYSYPQTLSGGMRQRVSFIRTLLTDAEILLLDEPFSALDAITREDLQKWLLDKINLFNKSMLFITHDIDEALFLSDKILVCKNKPLTGFIEFKISKNYDAIKLSEIKKEILSVIKCDSL
ncbi:ATP-binding cassette domain-containing protein [uncultured Cetobacterium sp.]|uniref:ABC transporter ATP-binding protein n=1 Tax=uncultured Cetobacterium sp. TaxID=527638 RepID=UPI002621EDD9|nr:ATP-binding cassette domain-containing protein [uncultured Cetobacterium sp.]